MRTVTVGLLLLLTLMSGCFAIPKQRCASQGGTWDAWSGCYNASNGAPIDVSDWAYQRPTGGNPAAMGAYLMLQGMNQPTRTPLYQPRSLGPALNCQSFGVGSSVQTTCY